MSKFKYGMCLSDYQKNKEYMHLSRKRSQGKLPEPEHSKATAKIINTLIKGNFSLLDVGSQTGHFFRTFNRVFKTKIKYIGLDPYKIHTEIGCKIWKNFKNCSFKLGWVQKIPLKKNSVDITLCSNVLTHVPNIGLPLKEMLRVSRKFIILRTPVHYRSYRIQMVYNKKVWKYSNIKPENEFDKNGKPREYNYFDVHSKDYLLGQVKKFNKKASVKFIKDTFWDAKKINSKSEKKVAPTRVIAGNQVADLLIIPHYFVIIRL